jgi:hypothetical protein
MSIYLVNTGLQAGARTALASEAVSTALLVFPVQPMSLDEIL